MSDKIEKQDRIDDSEGGNNTNQPPQQDVPFVFKNFLESKLFTDSVQPDGSVKFPTHTSVIRAAYDQLKKNSFKAK